MAASPPKIWFSAKTGIKRIGRAPVFETIEALHLPGGGPFHSGTRLAEAPAGR